MSKDHSPSIKDDEQYEEWTMDGLHERARELEIDGRSRMNKGELIDALRT